MHAQREKSGFEVNALGRMKAGDEMGCVCECGRQWYFGMDVLNLLRLFGDGMKHFIALAKLCYCTSDS